MMNIQPQGRHRQHADAAKKFSVQEERTTQLLALDPRSNDAYEPFRLADKSPAFEVIMERDQRIKPTEGRRAAKMA